MNVSDIMHKSLVTVDQETPIKEVARLIFTLGLAGIPVVEGTKLIGLITEQDILSKMRPEMKDLVEDYVHAHNFFEMENNLRSIFEQPAKEIMNKNVTTINEDTPIMHAQSTMLLHGFSHLPIVDNENNLIGIINQGDIFRYLVRNQIPEMERERYAGFIGKHHDLMINWKRRFRLEFPALAELFAKNNSNSILDLGVWTGEYSIGISQHGGYKILGLDHNAIMIKMANDKKIKLTSEEQKNIEFMLTDFTNLSKQVKEKYDAAICMGNALPYIPAPLDILFRGVGESLRKDGVLLLQILNFEKILEAKRRLLDFKIRKDPITQRRNLFIEFYDPDTENSLMHHVIIFENDSVNWVYKGITSLPIKYITQYDIQFTLEKAGFKDISITGSGGEYQGNYGKLSFDRPFDPLRDDWMNVFAKK